jgi:coenzyme F420-0:L-glutamate ligase/coenzyme F420-1:gamma-L-glutamate ligase
MRSMKTKLRNSVPRTPLPASDGDIHLFSIPGLPEIRKGDNLARLISLAATQANIALEQNDILVVAQKIISKAEGRVVQLSSAKPSPKAKLLAAKLKKDARFIEIILKESRRVVRSEHVLIVETHHGFVCANAGVDRSNVAGRDAVALLPKNPDRSAQKLRAALTRRTRKKIAVIVSDTFGRAWRLGLTNVAIGAAGLPVMIDLRGQRDRHRKLLHATILAVADELAAAAGLLMGKSSGTPVILIRGYHFRPANDRAARILRPAHEDLFR